MHRQRKVLNAINTQLGEIMWAHETHTTPFKITALESIKDNLERNPESMCKYILDGSRRGGFQNKLFQTYIKLMQNKLPLVVTKGKENFIISDISDPRLNIFDGVSSFNGIVDSKGMIKNNTQEIYIGSRASTYIMPYYIGKLLEVNESESGKNLIQKIKSYSFQAIITTDIAPNTKVTVSHLRVVPHYQMGAMLYINKARKIVVDEARKL